FYKAGTILEVDIQIGTQAVLFTVSDADLPNPRAFDLQQIVTHELGHALRPTHSLHSQRSERDGRRASVGVVLPHDTFDKLALPPLDTDDIAWASYLYPVGPGTTGPAARSRSRIPFAQRYGLISGTVRHGRRDLPLPGGAVFAVDADTNELVVSGYSGSVQLSGNPVTSELTFLPPESGIVDGRYVIPVPAGTYSLYVRPAVW